MECRGLVAVYDAVIDAFTVYISSQGSHRMKRTLMDALDLNDNQLRVISPDVGGGFGPKGALYPEYPCVAVAAQTLGRPVKWIEDRRENFLATHQERDEYWDVEIAVDENAKILGLRGRMVHDEGAYLPWGLTVPWIAATTVPGPYVIPSYKLDVHRRLHQQDLDDAGARRRQARRRVRDGAADGSRGARAQARSGRGAAAQFRQARADAVSGRHRLPRRTPGHL